MKKNHESININETPSKPIAEQGLSVHERQEPVDKHPAEQLAKNRAHEKERVTVETREKVLHEALSTKELQTPTHTREERPHHITKQDKAHGFNTLMHHTRQRLNKPEQAFSAIIHHPFIERTSELAGKTIARPSGLLGAALAAGIGILFVYVVAKRTGFTLSGSEAPLLLGAGFVAGLLVEWAVKATSSVFKRH